MLPKKRVCGFELVTVNIAKLFLGERIPLQYINTECFVFHLKVPRCGKFVLHF